jgi:hypothetical protein
VVTLAIGIQVHSDPVIADQGRPDLATAFNGNYDQEIDRFGTVNRTAYDVSGRAIGVQVGTYNRSVPNGMTIEKTYSNRMRNILSGTLLMVPVILCRCTGPMRKHVLVSALAVGLLASVAGVSGASA